MRTEAQDHEAPSPNTEEELMDERASEPRIARNGEESDRLKLSPSLCCTV